MHDGEERGLRRRHDRQGYVSWAATP